MSAALGDQSDSLCAELDLLAEGRHLMVATLIDRCIVLFLGADDVVFEFAHSVELQSTCYFTEGLSCTVKYLVWGGGKGLTILVHVRTEEANRRLSCEGVHEGR